MNPADMAKQLKREAVARKQHEREQEAATHSWNDKHKQELASWIEEALASFLLKVEKKWFAGSDYYVMSRKGIALISCVIEWTPGSDSWDDGAHYIAHPGWSILVVPGEWRGPCERQHGYSADSQEELNKEVAKIMSEEM